MHDIIVAAHHEGQGEKVSVGGHLIFSDQYQGLPYARALVKEPKSQVPRTKGLDPTLLLDLVQGIFEKHFSLNTDGNGIRGLKSDGS